MTAVTQKRILIDGYNLAMPTGTGIATYGRNLATRVRELGHEVGLLYGLKGVPSDPDLATALFYAARSRPQTKAPVRRKLVRLVKNQWRPPAVNEIPRSDHVILRGTDDAQPYFDRIFNSDALFEDANFRFVLRRKFTTLAVPQRIDIAHWTYHLPILIAGAKNICTIHDVVPLILPHCYAGNIAGYHAMIRHTVRQFDHIVTVSEASRRDVINVLGVSPDKVTNTYQSSDVVAEASSLDEAQIRRLVSHLYGLAFGQYFLFYGAIEPKKNIVRMIEAYCLSGTDTPLVIVGKLGWMYDAELKLIASVNAAHSGKRRIIHMDYLPRLNLLSLIRGAKAVLFPSLYEGFGLAVVEAMQFEVPVLTSNLGALREVGGDAAMLVDPYDLRMMSEGIARLDTDENLRRNLVQKGMSQAQKFSAENYRENLRQLYEKVLGH